MRVNTELWQTQESRVTGSNSFLSSPPWDQRHWDSRGRDPKTPASCKGYGVCSSLYITFSRRSWHVELTAPMEITPVALVGANLSFTSSKPGLQTCFFIHKRAEVMFGSCSCAEDASLLSSDLQYASSSSNSFIHCTLGTWSCGEDFTCS